MEPKLVSITECCKILSLGRTTVYRLIADEQLETVKIGRRRLVRMESIKNLISEGASLTKLP
ncbi:helix-turn-helix domain-containing protein [Parasphingorhabdus halotolerans]|uniref:Helix-turn-helix domain-containing protein n=1 Tax=Parasphingorhabdus halotolerans TaxID=2725558 RepID=A0A6H2DQ36_9SPHN|nr:helix-turn-helix domain-containing protein [Parasphingorhabdus halotolerans]QJB69871.1 helix-turn-helix domain-containing protein [Parasphingorhabdus halotolerans]